MKTNWKKHKQICGIYCIRNIINNKPYIGRAKSVARRIYNHIYEMDHNTSHCIKLQRAWKKYGKQNFIYSIIEQMDKTIPNLKDYIADREVYWMDYYDSINNGYNLKRDSSSVTEHHPSTILKFRQKTKEKNPNFGKKWPEERKKALSDLKKKMIKDGEIKPFSKEMINKALEAKRIKWKENPELIRKMVEKCNITKIKYEIHQYNKEGVLLKMWKNILELAKHHPDYKRHNIYAVCSGEKPTMYGFIWKKVLKNS